MILRGISLCFFGGKELFGFWIIISNIKMYIMKIYKWQQNIMENVGKFSFLKLMFVALKMLMVSIKYWTHIVFQSRIMLTIIPQWATLPFPRPPKIIIKILNTLPNSTSGCGILYLKHHDIGKISWCKYLVNWFIYYVVCVCVFMCDMIPRDLKG